MATPPRQVGAPDPALETSPILDEDADLLSFDTDQETVVRAPATKVEKVRVLSPQPTSSYELVANGDQVELRVAELSFVLGRRLLLAELSLDPMHGPRSTLEVVEQRAFCHPVVRIGVICRHAPLVAPPELDLAPVGRALRRFLVAGLGVRPRALLERRAFQGLQLRVYQGRM